MLRPGRGSRDGSPLGMMLGIWKDGRAGSSGLAWGDWVNTQSSIASGASQVSLRVSFVYLNSVLSSSR